MVVTSQGSSNNSIGFPDWQNIRYIEQNQFPYVCPNDGYIYALLSTYYFGINDFLINHQHAIYIAAYNSTGFDTIYIIPVKKNDVISFDKVQDYGRNYTTTNSSFTIRTGLYWMPFR